LILVSLFQEIFQQMMSIKNILLVLVGSGIGGASRYVVAEFIRQKNMLKFPLGTCLINIVGCFIIGLILGYYTKNTTENADIKLLLTTGFCGGFTTFSAFAAENLYLIKSGNQLTALFYVVLSVLLGIFATFLGSIIIK
jgi:CrcB protein